MGGFSRDNDVVPKIAPRVGRGPERLQRVNVLAHPRAKQEAQCTDLREGRETIIPVDPNI